MNAYLYILRCADGSYYVGTTRGSLEKRLAEHEAGAFDGYTRPPSADNSRFPSAFRTRRGCRGRRATRQRLATRKEGGLDPG